MSSDNYWVRRAALRTSRRRVLQGMGVASAAAVFGASAVACGGDDDDDDAPGATNTTAPGETPQPTPAETVTRGGELIVRRPSATTFADPHRSSSGYDPTVNHLYAAPLLAFTGGQIAPSLVEEWEQPDPQQLTLTLRSGLSFTDGTPVNAEAIKYSLERQADPATASPRRSLLNGVTIEAVDELTARLTFETPNPAFIESLTMNSPAGLGALISPTAHAAMGDDAFNEAPVSVGPFMIESLALDADSVFVANPDWPITAPNGDKIPYLDKVIIRVIPQTAVAVAELQSGGIHVDYVFLGENVGQIQAQDDLDVLANPGAITQRIGIHLSKAPTDIVAFRKGLQHAFDREEFAITFTNGLGSGGRGPLTQLTWAYDESAPYYEYDEAKAREFISQAGLADGTTLNIATYTSGVYPRIGELIQSQLRRLNIDLTVDSMEVPVYTEKYRRNGEYSLGLEGGGAPQGDPYQYLETNFGSANAPGGTPMPEVDTLLAKALTEFDQDARKAVYRDIVQLDYDNAYKVWLIEAPTLAGIAKKAKGLMWLRSGSAMDVTQAWLEA